MAGRRYFQRGHASLPASPLGSGIRGVPRWLLGGVAFMVTLGLVYVVVTRLSSTHAESAAASDALRGPVSLQGNGGSLIDSALAKAHDGLSVRTLEDGSGLQTTALSDEGLAKVAPMLGQAEARLIGIYRLISAGQHREALAKAEDLVRDHPNFHLAHLVHGDLLSLQTRPIRQLGDVPDTKANAAAQQLAILREESRRRLSALTERPPQGAIPSQFLALSSQSRHAIAIDASRSRLYLFENQSASATETGNGFAAAAPKLKLLGDFYISVGLSGTEKTVEGDKRTPLGVYYITSSLNPNSLPDLYGVGALPINYPNPLDIQRGKTGSGIWLHGTPRDQFVRAPQASDGCVVLSNPDLERLLTTVQIRTTPVVIAPELSWVLPGALDPERRSFETALEAWRKAKSEGRMDQLRTFYSGGKDAGQMWPKVEAELKVSKTGREVQLKELSMLRWKDKQDTMVVTFGEVALGQSRGVQRRQYWAREHDQWKIFFEGTP